MNYFKNSFPRCEACRQSPSILLALSFLVMAGSMTTVALTATVEGQPDSAAEQTSEPAPFVLTPDMIKRAIESNGNNPVCFPGGGSAWFGSRDDCAGHTLYLPEDFGLKSPGSGSQDTSSTSVEQAPLPPEFVLTPEIIKRAIEMNGNRAVCFPNGESRWHGSPEECAGHKLYTPEEFGMESAGGSMESGALTPEQIQNAIKANNGHAVCFPQGTGWMGGDACGGATIYKPEDYGFPPAPGGENGTVSEQQIRDALMRNFNHSICIPAGSTAWTGNTDGCTGKVYKAEDVGLQSPAEEHSAKNGFGGDYMTQMGAQVLRECENLQRPLTEGFMPEEMRASMKDAVLSLVQECSAAANAAAASAQNDPSKMSAFFQSMPGFYQKLEALMRSGGSCMGVKMQMKGMAEGAKNAAGEIALVKKTQPAVAAEMQKLQQQTLQIAEKGKALVASGQCDEAAKLLHEHQRAMEKAFHAWGHGAGDLSFIDERAVATEFMDQVGDDSTDVEVLMQHYDAEELQFASEIVNFGGKDLVKLLKDERTANLIKSVAGNGNQAALTAAMMQRIKELETKVSTLEQKLSDAQKRYAEELLALTPAPETGKFIEDFVQNQLSALEGLPPEAIRKIVDDYKRRNGEELKALGIVKFADTDPKDWYTPHASKAADAGILTGEGETGKFNPGGNVNGAQLAKILSTAMGLETADGATPSDPHFADYPSWSLGYIAALEEAGMELGAYVSADPSAPVEKIKLATALAQLIDEGNFKKSGFSKVFIDLGGRSEQEKQAVALLSSLGVVSGENNGDTFQPKANVSRAVLAKMIGNMLDLIAASGKKR